MTDEDYEYVRKNYQQKELKEIAKDINKHPATISKALRKLGLYKQPAWSDKEIQFLKDNFGTMSYKEIGLRIGRTSKSVSGKAHVLGLTIDGISKNWTREELEILKANVHNMDYESLHKLLPNRSIGAIYNKVYELQLNGEQFRGYKKLKMEQILFILENCSNMTDLELAYKFNVSETAIRDVRRKHGIKKEPSLGHVSFAEKKVEAFLNEIDVGFVAHQKLGRYIPDFQIKNTKTIIEVQGDYYHCNPKLYPDGPKNEHQIKYIINDYYKKCFYVGNGYVLIELWEHDIINNFDNVQKVIKENLSAVLG
jgi:very-short-patch-repair endonuclease